MKSKYKMIYDDLKAKIDRGEYEVGDQLPDELSLCKIYDCSRMTVKKACDMLVEEGMIYRKQGQGSFVLSRKKDDGEIEIQERELTGFSRASHGVSSSKILRFQLIFATKDIAAHLAIKENDPVYDILRVRYLNGKPYVIEQTYMSPALIPGITEDVLKKSIYTYIEEELGKKISAAQKTSRADVSNDLDHRELGLKNNEPVLEVTQTAYLDNGTPFEYSIARHRYDLFCFSVYSLRRS